MGLLSRVLGGNKAYKESIKDLQKAKDLEMNYYQEQAYADPLQDSANQAALRQARELLMANNKRTAGTAPCRQPAAHRPELLHHPAHSLGKRRRTRTPHANHAG